MNKWMSKTAFMILFNVCTLCSYWISYGFENGWISIVSIAIALVITNALMLRSFRGFKWDE